MYDYSLESLGSMVSESNRHRVDAYRRAMAEVITPSTVVVEIGTGIGFFAMLACQLGAQHVYAVEPNPLVQLGEELARLNGCADRITFINAMGSDVTLPEPADVMVSDIRGSLPWFADHIPAMADARRRLLKPGGIQIPTRDTVWAALVNAPGIYRKRLENWDHNLFGVDLSPARERIVNMRWRERIGPENLMTEPECWATLDYRTIDGSDTDADAELRWTITQPGGAHGLSLWFESDLLPGVHLSNAPDQPQNPIYGQSFLPLERPLELGAGDAVDVQLSARRIENSYVWNWTTRHCGPDGHEKALFRQSTFRGRQWTIPTSDEEATD